MGSRDGFGGIWGYKRVGTRRLRPADTVHITDRCTHTQNNDSKKWACCLAPNIKKTHMHCAHTHNKQPHQHVHTWAEATVDYLVNFEVLGHKAAWVKEWKEGVGVCFGKGDRCGSIKAVVRHQIPTVEITLNKLEKERRSVHLCNSLCAWEEREAERDHEYDARKRGKHEHQAVHRVSVLTGEQWFRLHSRRHKSMLMSKASAWLQVDF